MPGDSVILEGISNIGYCQYFFKIWQQDPCQIFTCTSSLLQDSRWTCTFLIDLEMVSGGMEYQSEVYLEVSSRSDIWNNVETTPVIQVFSWIQGGYVHSWLTWRWCQVGWNLHQKCLWRFHRCLTSGIMSRLHLPSKSLPGVLEDMDNPNGPGNGREHPSKASVEIASRSNLFWLF